MVDSGCQLWVDCFTCPYPDCVADTIPSLLTDAKRAEARELAEQGMSKAEIAQKLGIAERTVSRYLDTFS